jgi:CheY-like chemotaxis protein
MSASLSVLVVDDDQVALDLLREILVAEGYDVTVAQNGADALAHIVAHPFHLMITDLELSGFNGLDLIVATKHCRPGIPIIVLTASSQQSTLRDAVRLGATRVLSKPQHQSDLIALMNYVLPRG